MVQHDYVNTRSHPLLCRSENSELLCAALHAAKTAAGRLRQEFLKPLRSVWKKDDTSVGTDIEVRVEEEIRTFLTSQFQHIGFEGEEAGKSKGITELTWRADPLDGTDNYVSGIPYFATSIALVARGSARLGVLINPITDEIFMAERGSGAYLNCEKLCPIGETRVNLLRVGISPDFTTKRSSSAVSVFAHIRDVVFRVFDTWAPTLDWCMLAKGSIDALVGVAEYASPEDAGSLIAAEAGMCILRSSELLPSIGGHHWIVAMRSKIDAIRFAATFLGDQDNTSR